MYQTCPSANYFDCKAMAVGSRSQSARTYLEKHLEEFLDCDTDELIKHGLRALRDTLPNEVELNTKVHQAPSFTIYLVYNNISHASSYISMSICINFHAAGNGLCEFKVKLKLTLEL